MYTHITEATAGFAGHKAQNTDPNRAGPEAQRTQDCAPKLREMYKTIPNFGITNMPNNRLNFQTFGSWNKN